MSVNNAIATARRMTHDAAVCLVLTLDEEQLGATEHGLRAAHAYFDEVDCVDMEAAILATEFGESSDAAVMVAILWAGKVGTVVARTLVADIERDVEEKRMLDQNAIDKSAREVEAALAGVVEARSHAKAVCRAYAQRASGWAPGLQLQRRWRGRRELVEVVRFLGAHPRTWQEMPVVACAVVNKNGSAGKRELFIEIDTDGHWRQRWISA